MLLSASWSAMVLPTVFLAAGTDIFPSISINPGGHGAAPGHSLVKSIAGVSASVPQPPIGHTGALDGLSVVTSPVARFGMHAELCQSGLLSLRTPKFDPPTTSR